MREDMAKVITERAREGPRDIPESPEYRRHFHWTRLREEGREVDSPRREKISAIKWSHNRRSFSDLLGPLVGFLRKRKGRPWDDVWSELCATLDRGSTTQRHVLEHVTRDFVVIHTKLDEDGEVVRSSGQPIEGWRRCDPGLFYVCPTTRRLIYLPPLASVRGGNRRKPTVDVRQRYHLVGGVWYEVEFATLGDRPVWDTIFRELAVVPTSSWARGSHWKDGGPVYAARKRQLSTRELRALGLRA